MGFSPKQIICGTIYKTLSGFFIIVISLPGRCPSLCYFSRLGKSEIVPVHKSLIYEQGTPICDFRTARSWQIRNLQSLIDVGVGFGVCSIAIRFSG